MAQKRIKRTDQEWFELIRDCKTSSLKVKTWCEQHGITAKALDYHTRRLRQNGYTIPQKIAQTVTCEKHEIVCRDIPQSISGTKKAASALTRSLSISWCSTLISTGYLWTSPMMRRRNPHKNPSCAAEPVLGDLSGVSKLCLITGLYSGYFYPYLLKEYL